MLKEWQFTVLFCVGVGGAIFLLVAPSFGVPISENPLATAGVGTILAYVLTQKRALTRNNGETTKKTEEKKEGEDDQLR